jgi:hypothetical protein
VARWQTSIPSARESHRLAAATSSAHRGLSIRKASVEENPRLPQILIFSTEWCNQIDATGVPGVMSNERDKPFFVRLNFGTWGGQSVDLPGAWGVTAPVVFAIIVAWVAFAIAVVLCR